MDLALRLEELYHKIMLNECKTEEAIQWENARNEVMTQSIKETIDYYAKFYYVDPELER